MTISASRVFTRLDDVMSQLEKSWPETFNKIVSHPKWANKKEFFIHTFTKWNYEGENPIYIVYHQPRNSMPDPFWGTILRKITPHAGTCEFIWALPHVEGINNYAKGKLFEEEFVAKCIEEKKCGALDRIVKKFNEKLRV